MKRYFAHLGTDDELVELEGWPNQALQHITGWKLARIAPHERGQEIQVNPTHVRYWWEEEVE